jgi:hypothetical protein
MLESVAFSNRRGRKLVADRLHATAGDRAPVVLFSHDCGSNRASPRARSRQRIACCRQVVAVGREEARA